ncbi:MAG: hypothetical protein CMP59_02880 [Flavobacteriales bacterium]|nr:hypothetical protein [Flavobacteriales bacterium]|tara:strand:+ start:950 stop:1195 length:246 start_codon:yes stop_codon:yes gene_type:complete
MENNHKIILAAIIGAAAGAVAGLLLAPGSGEETIEEAKKKAGELKKDLNEGLEELANKGKEKLDQITKEVSDVIKEAEAKS